MKINFAAGIFFITALCFSNAEAQTVSAETRAFNLNLGKSNQTRIYAVVIGISEYTDAEQNLTYAAHDAEKFYNFLRSPNGGLVPAENITLLTNEKAKKSDIIRAIINRFGHTSVTEEDEIILYFSCHGEAGIDSDDLFFMAHDSEFDNVEGTGISETELLKYFEKSKAKKRVRLYDVCQAGLSYEAQDGGGRKTSNPAGIISPKPPTEEAIKNYYIKLGGFSDVNIRLAAGAAQSVNESEKWQGGVFTHYLMRGLKGEANRDNNRFIGISEIFDFVNFNVEKDTRNTKNPQQPTVSGASVTSDFPLSVINTTAK